MFKSFDLFCGCGGMSAGLKDAGFKVLGGAEIDPVFSQTFKSNFPDALVHTSDLSKTDPMELLKLLGLKRGELDLLVGGPPCQGFSKNVPRRNRFLEDPKNLLVSTYISFVEKWRPKAFVMENVAEMKNGFEASYTNEILSRLNKIGYVVSHEVLHAADYGVPQRRRRAFFVGIQGGTDFKFPEPTHAKQTDLTLFSSKPYVSVWDAISDLPSLKHGEGEDEASYSTEPQTEYQTLIRRGSNLLTNHVARKLEPTQLKRLSVLKPGQGIKDLPDELRPKGGYSGAYGRLTKDMVAPTITRWVFHPGSGRFGHPVTPRVITIREAARIQGFPDWFRFTGKYIQQSHQVGNAVPPLLMKAVAMQVKAHLEGNFSSKSERAKKDNFSVGKLKIAEF